MKTRRLKWARPLATLLAFAMILQSAPAAYAAPSDGESPDPIVTETGAQDPEITETDTEVPEETVSLPEEESSSEEVSEEVTSQDDVIVEAASEPEEKKKEVTLLADPDPSTGFTPRSTMDLAKKVKPAILEDRIADASKKIDPVIENYAVSASAAGNDTIKVTVSGNNLMRHANADGMEAYWVGVAIAKEDLPAGCSVKFWVGREAPDGDEEYKEQTGGEAPDDYTFYFGKLSAETPFPTYYVSARYYEGDTAKQTVNYIVDFSKITFKEVYPSLDEVSAVTAALPVDADEPSRKIYSDYKLGTVVKGENNDITVPIQAADLLKHTAGAAAGEGYWVGAGIPDLTGAGFTAQYLQSYTAIDDISASTPGWKSSLDDVLTVDGKSYKTVYFNAADTRLVDNTGYVYVKYTSVRSADDMRIYTFKVNMAGVTKAMALGANDIIAANLDDRASANAMTVDKLYKEGTYKATTTSEYNAVLASETPVTIPVKIEAVDLMIHAAGNGYLAYWVGLGIPKAFETAAPDVKYYAGFEVPSADMITSPVSSVKDDEQVKDGVTYDTFYFGADKLAGTNKKAYLAVKLTDGELTSTVIYELDFSGVKLKKTDYTVEISESGTEVGKLLEIGTTGTSTVKAVVKKGTEPAANVPVKWTSSDTNIASVAAVSTANTGDDGSVTANITLGTVAAPAKVTITATAAGRNIGTYNIEFYAKETVTGEDALTLELPSETECALTPGYTLPAGSAYRSAWVSSDTGVATVNEYGVVTAKGDGAATFDQCIVDAVTGDPVDKFGKAATDSDKMLKTVAGTYKVTVNTVLQSISIEETGKSIYANGETVEDALELVLNPATFDKSKVTSVTWRSGRTAVADVASGTDDYKADITGHMSGSNTVYVEVVAEGRTYKTSKVVIIKPVVEGIAIGRKGDETEPASSGNVYDVAKGTTVLLYTKIENEGGAEDTVTWTSSDPSVARVDSKGVVTALKKGSAAITAKVPDGSFATATINVVENLTSLSTDIKNISLNAGDEVAVEAVISSSAAVYSLEWKTSEDEKEDEDKIISIEFEDTKAVITALKKGSATVTVKDTVSGLKSSVNVVVAGRKVPITALTTKNNSYTLFAGNSTALSYTAVPADFSDAALVWSSTDPDKVSVSDTGVVTALAVTDSPVYVTVQAMKITGVDSSTYKNTYEEILDKRFEPIRVKFKIEVKDAPVVTSVTVEPKNVGGLKKGESVKLKAKAYPEYVLTAIRWSSDNEDAVSVDENGVITANAPGRAVITATADNDVSGSAVITVAEAAAESDIAANRKVDGEIWIGAIEDQTYTGSAITPEPNVYYGDILLTKGTDYTLSYKDNTSSDSDPVVIATGKGNYKGTAKAEFNILKASLTDETIVINRPSSAAKVLKTGGYKEQLLKPVITYKGKTLKAGRDYELYYTDETEGAYEAPGAWNIDVYGIGDFRGELTVTELLADPKEAKSIAKAKIKGIEEKYFYTGEAIVPEEVEVKLGTVLTEGEDYEITYIKNTGLGTATATITGIGSYYGVKKKTFKIVPKVVDLSKAEDDILMLTLDDNTAVALNKGFADYEYADDMPVIAYSKAGTKPANVVVEYDGNVLGSGDYKVSNKLDLQNNLGTLTIKGKGKFYKGSASTTYVIGKTDLSDYTYVIDDFVYSSKANAYKKNKLTVYDPAGKALTVDKDYKVTYEAESIIPAAGSYVTVTVEGMGFYEGGTTLSFRVIEKSQKLSAASYEFIDRNGKVKKASKFSVKYEGSPVVIDKDQIVLKVKRKVGRTNHWVTLDDSDYEIVAYRNNNKVGTTSVILKGTGEYGGLKTIKFKIKK